MADHDHHGAAEQGLLRAQQPVRDQRAEDREDVHRAAVRADDAEGYALVDPQATGRGREVHVDREDALHAVEAERYNSAPR